MIETDAGLLNECISLFAMAKKLRGTADQWTQVDLAGQKRKTVHLFDGMAAFSLDCLLQVAIYQE